MRLASDKVDHPCDNLALSNRSQTCQGTIPPSSAGAPVSECSPARQSRTSSPNSPSPVTLYRWRRQALIDALAPGGEELRDRPSPGRPSAHQKTRSRVEAGEGGEHALRGESRRQPKSKYQVVRGLNNLGYSERLACATVGLSRSTYNQIKFHKPTDREIRHLLRPTPSPTSRPGRECPLEWWDLRAGPGTPGTTRRLLGP